MIASPNFGNDETCIGAELEVYLMDHKNEVSPVNLELLEMLNDEQFQAELNQFNSI